MVVPKGYKQTVVGIIPEDWKCIAVNDVLEEISMGPFGSDITVSNFIKSGVPVLNGNNISSVKLKDVYKNFVTLAKAKSLKKAIASRGDIIVTHRGTLGQISYIPNDSVFEKYVISQSQFRLKLKKERIFPHFFVAYFLSNNGQKHLLEGKGHTGVPALAQPTTKFRKLFFPCPSNMEQKAIAAVLSDIDELVRSIEKLIARKKDIKLGTMQELLTGKRRLPGFSRKWIYKKAGDFLQVCHGKSQHDIQTINGKYPILASGGEIGRTNIFLYDEESVLIGRKGTIDKPQYVNMPFWTIDTLFYTKIFNNYSGKFIFYLFSLVDWIMYNEASGVPSLNSKTIENIEFLIPEYEEQVTVASILSDMDVEIEALEQKLAKYKDIKQGMMQELLTGRIRLVETKAEAQKSNKVEEFHLISSYDVESDEYHEDAIAIAAIVNDFYSQYALGRKKVQKLLYLLRRHQNKNVSKFSEKAAGPYNYEARYDGGEPLAIQNNYINVKDAPGRGSLFSKGGNIHEALKYLEKENQKRDFEWLLYQFQYSNVNWLEVLATVDNAILKSNGYEKTISLQDVKQYIQNSPEWKAKLKKESFSDENIRLAMTECRKLFYNK
jgi:type I restriction enzyme S subunit